MNTFEALAIDWLRATRGRRSQRSYSRRLGYQSNIAYRWESGRCWPKAATALRAMIRVRTDIRRCMIDFYGRTPAWLDEVDPASREGAARLLDDLRGGTPIVQLAARSGYTRYQVARWLSGATEPRLPEWLALIEATSFRLLDFVAAFFDPASLPSVSKRWARLKAAREAAYERPESHIVLRALELAEYRSLKRHSDAFLGRRIGISEKVVRESLAVLAAASQIRREGDKWVLSEDEGVTDTREDPARSRALRSWWLRRAAAHVEAGREGIFGYNLFAVSERDMSVLREIHLRYYREMQEVIARSRPSERVALFAAQLFLLDET